MLNCYLLPFFALYIKLNNTCKVLPEIHKLIAFRICKYLYGFKPLCYPDGLIFLGNKGLWIELRY